MRKIQLTGHTHTPNNRATNSTRTLAQVLKLLRDGMDLMPHQLRKLSEV